MFTSKVRGNTTLTCNIVKLNFCIITCNYIIQFEATLSIMESFSSAFMLNVEWSPDLRYDINVHCERQWLIFDQHQSLTKWHFSKCFFFKSWVAASVSTSKHSDGDALFSKYA